MKVKDEALEHGEHTVDELETLDELALEDARGGGLPPIVVVRI